MRAILLVVLSVASVARGQSLPLDLQLPAWARARWKTVAARHALVLSSRVNPFLQRGDFDGDGAADVAVLVEATAGRKVGIAILHRAGSDAFVLGAGADFGNGGDDFEWLDVWSVEEGPAPRRRPERFHLEKEGSASARVSFRDGRYRWEQAGD